MSGKQETIKETIGFIGGGNMAKAICDGIVRKGLINYSQVHVSGPHLENLAGWKSNKANITNLNGYVVEQCDVIFLCVKPHIFETALKNIQETIADPTQLKPKLFVSVMAGIRIEQLENALKSIVTNPRVIRTMPNTPLLVGEGCTVYSPGQNATENDLKLIETILSVSGICKQVPESLINPFGALTGGGPAFIFLVIEALADGGVKMGIPRNMANQFAAQTVLGAAKMCLDTGKHPGVLKDEVCSPSGTTITGIHALERGGVRAAFMDAIEMATKRAEELGVKK